MGIGFIPGGGYHFDGGEPTMGTNDSWPIWGGKGTPGSTIEVEIDGQTYKTQVDENGTWDFTPPKPLSNGEHEITFTEKDPKTGEVTDSQEITRNIDANAEARANDEARHKNWETGGRQEFRDLNAPGGRGGRPQTGGGGGGGGGTGEHLTTGPGAGTGTQTGGGGGGGGSPQSEKGNQARPA